MSQHLQTRARDAQVPRTADSLADQVLALAGIDLEARAGALRKAFEHALNALEAKDPVAGAAARKDLIKLTLGSEQRDARPQGPSVVIPMPAWAQGVALVPAQVAPVAQVIDTQGEVSDAEFVP